MLNVRFGPAPEDGPRSEEPKTVPEAQRWLHNKGFNECTEDDAKGLLLVRKLVRDGRLVP